MDVFSRKKDFYQDEFNKLSFSNKKIELKHFEKCIFKKCSFSESVFDKCKFIDCEFIECDLSNTKPYGSIFIDTKFKDSKIIGFDLTKAGNLRDLKFQDCKLDYSNFNHLKLPALQLINCSLKKASFIETDLTKGKFNGSDFEKASFHKANLTEANFCGASNYWMDYRQNTLKAAKFSLPEAINLLRCLDISIE